MSIVYIITKNHISDINQAYLRFHVINKPSKTIPMSMSVQQLSDRIEIQDLLIAYCTAIDSKKFDDLDHIFTADAYIDYTAFGGAKGVFSEAKAYLQKALKEFPNHQHLLSNIQVRVDGDTATSRCMCHNPMVIPIEKDQTQTAFFGLWYDDELVRTKAGWRIKKRVIEGCYAHNLPKGFEAVAP